MQWHSVSEFFAMGGYAFYVWGSFGVTAAAIALESWLIHRRRLRAIESLREEQAEGPAEEEMAMMEVPA
ncbi:MAG TPA: heme exporter protein CcmD [Ramlibacter sp.]|uniref:heme exporter protein CcmD n=1 Tax=Ramlibacter sp. TaxID=1917967 RepID=UPI002BB8EFF7|nr:heme exporter protein CcmD [Ramlibacter sp.]HVZ43693.1 heme exporter protein CcmD [Ramlibacter sp.]